MEQNLVGTVIDSETLLRRGSNDPDVRMIRAMELNAREAAVMAVDRAISALTRSQTFGLLVRQEWKRNTEGRVTFAAEILGQGSYAELAMVDAPGELVQYPPGYDVDDLTFGAGYSLDLNGGFYIVQ